MTESIERIDPVVADLLRRRADEYRVSAQVHARAAVNWQGVANDHEGKGDQIVYETLAQTQSDLADACANAARTFARLAEGGARDAE